MRPRVASRRSWAPGIRGRILGYYGATLLFVLAIEVIAQGAASRAGREFEVRLARYHAVQELRVNLADCRALAAQYLRERLPEQARRLGISLEGLLPAAASLSPLADESLDEAFELRAVVRGLEAWLPLVRGSLGAGVAAVAASAGADAGGTSAAAAGTDSWQTWLKAERVADYVDGYLGKLLSLAMATGSASYHDIAERQAENRRLALLGILGTGALAMLFAALFASSISAPIRRLAEAAHRMSEGDLAVEAVVARSGDEVTVLAQGFNAMASNIRAMVEGLREKAELERRLHEETLSLVSMGKALREAQFMYLQGQIRPHFLFNALNTIARSALLEGAGETERLAQSLGRLLRYSLAEGGASVGLGEELASLREYLSFQGIRFGSRLAWEIRAEAGLEGFSIPRFSLQPLVENAVRHGIEPKVEGGRVIVSARRAGGRLRILVLDSGAGMTFALLERLRAAAAGHDLPSPSLAPSPGEGAPGIGLANIVMRLALRFGDDIRLGLASSPGRGSVVRLSLPLGTTVDKAGTGESREAAPGGSG